MKKPTTCDFTTAFDSLLASWNAHHTLKDQQAPLSALWSSHCELMDSRQTVSTALALTSR